MRAGAIAVVVVLLVGGFGYALFSTQGPRSTPRSTCQPAASPVCGLALNLHDLALSVPIRSTQVGTPVPITAVLPGGESASRFTVDFGDGNKTSGTVPSVDHTYGSPGIYILSAQATVGGQTHDSDRALVVLTVSTSFASAMSAQVPVVLGSIVGNSTSPPHAARCTAILSAGGSATFNGRYTSGPTDPQFAALPPEMLVGPGGTLTNVSNTTSSTTATAHFPSGGPLSWVKFRGWAQGPGGARVAQDFVWTVYVAAPHEHAGAQPLPAAAGPHRGSLVAYEDVAGGAYSEDPAIDYDTAGQEVMINVYQTLIAYNGSRVGSSWNDYVPWLSTCVPGSPLCSSLYGASLIDPSQTNYTFVIDHGARFFDPHTRATWGVYPTDVLFSAARTMAFSTGSCWGCTPGWFLTQSLLPLGNGSWDALHTPVNNTPQRILSSITVNGSSCPRAALMNEHGCVTFHADAQGKVWPSFLEFVADSLGSSVVPCGWFSAPAQGAGIPNWTAGLVTGTGDHPCLLPAGASASTDPAFLAAVAAIPPTAWDSYESAGPTTLVGDVQWNMAGSGPYYQRLVQPGNGYQLEANPGYRQPEYCHFDGCAPAPGQFAGNVTVTWENTALPGEQAYLSGIADFATIPPTDTALLLEMVQNGRIGALSFPTVSVTGVGLNFNFNIPAASSYSVNSITVPADFLSYVGMRQFLVHAYPYQTIERTISTVDGIQYFFNNGGVIPQFLGIYHPSNVSFPVLDPDRNSTDVGGAAWWWAEAHNSASPWFDPELGACRSTSPCEFPLFTLEGLPDWDLRFSLFAAAVANLSGGAVKVDPVDVTGNVEATQFAAGPGNDGMAMWSNTWIPDFPDPTDYVTPLLEGDAGVSSADAIAMQLALPAFNASSCHAWTDYSWYAAQAAAPGSFVGTDCQGAAFAALNLAIRLGAHAPEGPARALLYNEVEQISNELAVFIYPGQANFVETYSAWIDPSTLNTNVVVGAGGMSPWFSVGGAGVV